MIKTKRGLGREALEFERVLTVNMLRARLKGLVLAWPDLGALPQGAGGGGGREEVGALAMSGCRDRRGFGRVKYV